MIKRRVGFESSRLAPRSKIHQQARERDVAPWEERSLMVVGSILHGGPHRAISCSSQSSTTGVTKVFGSILHGVDPSSYCSFQPVLNDWCNKGRGMCYPVCGIVHIKESLLLIEMSSPCGGDGITLSLSEWSFTICLTPYNRK